jgi:hypothetical protein
VPWKEGKRACRAPVFFVGSGAAPTAGQHSPSPGVCGLNEDEIMTPKTDTSGSDISTRGAGMTKEEKFVIFASSLGSVFEWYDFYLYAVLAPFFAALFFPPGNDTAALLSAFATYAAGFLVRPLARFSHITESPSQNLIKDCKAFAA